MLQTIQERLTAAGLVLPSTWVSDIQEWGKNVALYREYAEGEHRAYMTTEMRKMLRISDARNDQFSLNYCDLVIQRMSDRLVVTSVDGDTDQASEWSNAVLTANRFDGLQMDVHEASIRDGITFVMATYDNSTRQIVLVHELAWDGDTGMIPVYDRMGKRVLAVVKVWYEGSTTRRVNIYYADRVEKYDAPAGGALLVHSDTLERGHMEEDRGEANGVVPWVNAQGQPIGVPVIPFVNRAKTRLTTGTSEIGSVISVQDSLNRTLVSMVMTSELSAFQIKVALGFLPPAEVTPGMWVVVGEGAIPADQKVDAFVLEQAQLVPFISQAQFLIDQIGTISQTPLPGQMGGDSASGEAIKQRETGLVGKIKRFQIKGGNAWEDVLSLAANIQNAFGTTSAPRVGRWVCRWQDAESRNDAEVVANVKLMRELMGDEQALREVAGVFGWDETQIQRIMVQKQRATVNALAALPNFDSFGANVQST